MEALARSLVQAVPAIAGVPFWTVTLLVMVVTAAGLLVFALPFGGGGRWWGDARGGPDRLVRDPGGDGDPARRADRRLAPPAGHRPPGGGAPGGLRVEPLPQPVHLLLLLPVLHGGAGRDQPDAVRPPRGRVGARLRVQRGGFGDPVRLLLPGRVRRHVHRGCPGDRLLPGRVARAVLPRRRAAGALGEPPLPRCLPRQGVRPGAGDDVGPLDAAAAARGPAHADGLEIPGAAHVREPPGRLPVAPGLQGQGGPPDCRLHVVKEAGMGLKEYINDIFEAVVTTAKGMRITARYGVDAGAGGPQQDPEVRREPDEG